MSRLGLACRPFSCPAGYESASMVPGTGDELVMQDDGNLVLYRNGGKVMWASDD